MHLINQNVTTGTLKLVEHHDPLRVSGLIFEEVEEAFEEVRVVLSQEVPA